MATLTELTQVSEMIAVKEAAVSKINTALASITSARNELAVIDVTYDSLAENTLYADAVVGIKSLADDIDGLFSSPVSTAPQIEG